MTRLGLSPLVYRITLLLTGIFALALIVAGTVSWFLISGSYDAQLRREIAADAAELKQRIERLKVVAVIDAIDYRLAKSYGTESEVVYLLVDADGAVITGNLDAWPADIPPESNWARLHLYREGKRHKILAHMEQVDGHYWLLTGRTLAAATQFQTASALILIAVGSLAILGAGLLTILFSRSMARRFDTVTETLDRFARGEASVRSGLSGTDDIARLSAGIDRLLATVDRQLYHLRNISRVLAHEFRSPLSHAQDQLTSVEAARPEDEALLASAQETISELLTLSNELLDIAEYESSAAVLPDRVNLETVLNRIAGLLGPVAEEAGISIECASEPVSVRGEQLLIERLVVNLLENAIEATPAGGRVVCQCGQDGDGIFVRIEDQGPGVDAGTLDELIRTQDERRSQSPLPGSHGIGLRLVRAIALRHGARVMLKKRGSGLSVRVGFQNS